MINKSMLNDYLQNEYKLDIAEIIIDELLSKEMNETDLDEYIKDVARGFEYTTLDQYDEDDVWNDYSVELLSLINTRKENFGVSFLENITLSKEGLIGYAYKFICEDLVSMDEDN